MLISDKEMWSIYRKIKKDKPSLTITCPVCNKEILEGEDGVIYSKTRLKSDIFIHKECMNKWE